MLKKYKAEHLTIFAVYRKCIVLGRPMRYLKVAYPDRIQAEEWVKRHADGAVSLESDFIVEEMSAIMKAWQP